MQQSDYISGDVLSEYWWERKISKAGIEILEDAKRKGSQTVLRAPVLFPRLPLPGNAAQKEKWKQPSVHFAH
jgi:hypothetical protein